MCAYICLDIYILIPKTSGTLLPYRALREENANQTNLLEKERNIILDEIPGEATTSATTTTESMVEEEGDLKISGIAITATTTAESLAENEDEAVVLPTQPREIKNGVAISEGIDFPCTQSNGMEALACQISCDGNCAQIATDVCKSVKHCIGFSVNRENTWATLKVSSNDG